MSAVLVRKGWVCRVVWFSLSFMNMHVLKLSVLYEYACFKCVQIDVQAFVYQRDAELYCRREAEMV